MDGTSGMGLYDRDYSRESFGGNRFSGINTPFTRGLSILALVCFVFSLFQRDLTERMALSWDHLLSDRWLWTLFTHPLFHLTTSPLFIVFNLLVIFFFGRELEERLGWQGMAWITGSAAALGAAVFLGGTAAGLFRPGQAILGLSGVANAVLVAAVLLDPKRSILLFFVLAIPGWMLVLLSLLFDLMRLSQGDGQAAADIAGLLAGGASYQFLTKGWQWQWRWPNRPTSFRRRGRPKLSVFRSDQFDETPQPATSRGSYPKLEAESTTLTASSVPAPASNLTLEVDRILEKISQQGLSSLTEAERQILLKASESLKKKS